MNIIICITDDMPTDAFAAQSMPWFMAQTDWQHYPNAILEDPMCGPGRVATWSGAYSRILGVESNGQTDEFDPSLSIAVALQRAGYTTGGFGKYLNNYGTDWGAGTERFPGWSKQFWMTSEQAYYDYTINDNGTEVAYAATEAEYATDVIFGKAIQFIQNVSQPFFLWLAPNAPHSGDGSGPEPAPRHASSPITLVTAPNFNEADISDKAAWLKTLRPNQYSGGQLNNILTNHADALRACLSLDEGLEDLDAALTTRGIRGETVIFFLTDNGHIYGNHRLQGKGTVYEEAVNAQIHVRHPGYAGATKTQVVSNIDIAPTICEVTGARLPHAPYGQSLMGLISGTSSTFRDAAYFNHNDNENSTPSFDGYRTTSVKYAEYRDDSEAPGQVESYDLTNDPYELDNVASTSSPNYVGAVVLAERSEKLARLTENAV